MWLKGQRKLVALNAYIGKEERLKICKPRVQFKMSEQGNSTY